MSLSGEDYVVQSRIEQSIYIYIHIDPLGLLFKKLLARPPKLSQKSLNV